MILKHLVMDCKTGEQKIIEEDNPSWVDKPAAEPKDLKAEYASASNKLDYIAAHLGLK